MAIWKLRSKRKASGGRYHRSHKKKARHTARDPVLAKLADKISVRKLRTCGGNAKTSLRGAGTVNLMIDGRAKKTKIESVVENPASRHFVRQHILSKGAIINTPEGLARITSRPTQDGVVNAVLVKKK